MKNNEYTPANIPDLDDCVEFYFAWMLYSGRVYKHTPEEFIRVREKFINSKSGDAYDYFYGHIWRSEQQRRRTLEYYGENQNEK